MIEIYVREFLEITKHLSRDKGKKKGDFLLVEKDLVAELLNRNLYQTADAKLRYWRMLGWTDTDQNRVTRRAHDENGKPILVIKINLKIYQTLIKIEEEGSL